MATRVIVMIPITSQLKVIINRRGRVVIMLAIGAAHATHNVSSPPCPPACRSVLAGPCPLPFKDEDACLECTRQAPDVGAACKPKDRHAYCETAAAKFNVLTIISDQHRWDCLGEAGNTIIHTPVLDQLAQDGVHFTKAYTVCPVCSPARSSMLAGRTPEQTQVMGNTDIATAPRQMTYDRLLLANGWGGEYQGKYHSPYDYTRDDSGKTFYDQPVQWLNGGCTPKSPPKGVQAFEDSVKAYLDVHEPLKELQLGQLLDGEYRRPYWADIADGRYDQAFNKSLLAQSNELIRDGKSNKVPKTDQQHVNGRLALAANHSLTAITLADGIAALDRLKAPFTLTVSFEAPHPPFITPSPFYGRQRDSNPQSPDPHAAC
jgi:arylsulfatase A-like enzyme